MPHMFTPRFTCNMTLNKVLKVLQIQSHLHVAFHSPPLAPIIYEEFMKAEFINQTYAYHQFFNIQ